MNEVDKATIEVIEKFPLPICVKGVLRFLRHSDAIGISSRNSPKLHTPCVSFWRRR